MLTVERTSKVGPVLSRQCASRRCARPPCGDHRTFRQRYVRSMLSASAPPGASACTRAGHDPQGAPPVGGGRSDRHARASAVEHAVLALVPRCFVGDASLHWLIEYYSPPPRSRGRPRNPPLGAGEGFSEE